MYRGSLRDLSVNEITNIAPVGTLKMTSLYFIFKISIIIPCIACR